MDASLHHRWGLALKALGDIQGAADAFNRSLAIKEEVNVLIDLGLVEFQLKFNDKAIEAFDRALSIDEKSLQALNNKGSVLYGLEKFDKAAECFEKALTIDQTVDREHMEQFGKCTLQPW